MLMKDSFEIEVDVAGVVLCCIHGSGGRQADR
jgi:hypothetical protein